MSSPTADPFELFGDDLSAIARVNRALRGLTLPEVTKAKRHWGGGAPHTRGLWSRELFGDPTHARFACLRMRVLHPAAVDRVAECLGVTAESVRTFSAFDTNHEELFLDPLARELESHGASEELRDAALVDVVPVPPPNLRPFDEPDPPRVDPWCGPVNECWLTLVHSSLRCRRLDEIESVPHMIRNTEMHAASEGFAQLLAVMRSRDAFPKPELLRYTLPVSPVPSHWPDSLPSGVLGLAWVDGEHLWVQRGRFDAIVSVSSGVEELVPSCGRVVQCRSGRVQARTRHESPEGQSGDVMVFDAWLPFGGYDALAALFPSTVDAPAGGGTPLFAPVARFDLRTREWLRDGEAFDTREWLFGDDPYGRESDGDNDDMDYDDDFDDDEAEDSDRDPEDADVLPTKRIPGPMVWTSDGRFVWWADGHLTMDRHRGRIVEVATGIPQWSAMLERDDDRGGMSVAVGVPREGTSSARAIALTDDRRWLLLHEDGRVTQGTTVLFRLEGAVAAAAFSPDGTKLAVATGDAIAVVECASGNVYEVPRST